MAENDDRGAAADRVRARHRVRMPGFVSDEEVGLGDAIGRATSAMGVRPCGGCLRRSAVLNQWLAFAPAGRDHGQGGTP